jgi:hypothetical protein
VLAGIAGGCILFDTRHEIEKIEGFTAAFDSVDLLGSELFLSSQQMFSDGFIAGAELENFLIFHLS